MDTVTAFKAVQHALRFKPGKFTVGEVTPGEACQLLQQLNDPPSEQVALQRS